MKEIRDREVVLIDRIGVDCSPANDDDWIVEAYYDIPIDPPPEDNHPVLSYNTCKILLERYKITPKERYIFPFEREQMEERLRTSGNKPEHSN